MILFKKYRNKIMSNKIYIKKKNNRRCSKCREVGF